MKIFRSCIFFGVLACSALPQLTHAQHSLAFEGSLGLPSATIQNPDGSLAHYQGISMRGGVSFPLLQWELFAALLTGSVNYLDLSNGANSASQKEFANHLGAGGGLRFQFAKLFVGMDYHIMAARHYSVGIISHALEYSYTSSSYYGGISIPFGSLAVGISYHVSQGVIPSGKTGLSVDSGYEDNLILLNLKWNTGASPGEFLGNLFQ